MTTDIDITFTFLAGATVDGDPRPHHGELKSRGWRWSRNMGAWYLPSSRGQSAEQYRAKIEDTARALRDCGLTVTTSIHDEIPTVDDVAALEESKLERAANRAEGLSAASDRAATRAEQRFAAVDATLDMIPPGQPVLMGHHSQRRHQNDLARMDRNMHKGVEAAAEAREFERRSRAAEHTAAGPTAGLRRRRIERLEADERRLLRVTPHNEGHRNDLNARLATVQAQLTHERNQLQIMEDTDDKDRPVGPDDFKVGDRVRRGTVRRVNRKSLTIQPDVFPEGIGCGPVPYSKLTVADIPEREDA